MLSAVADRPLGADAGDLLKPVVNLVRVPHERRDPARKFALGFEHTQVIRAVQHAQFFEAFRAVVPFLDDPHGWLPRVCVMRAGALGGAVSEPVLDLGQEPRNAGPGHPDTPRKAPTGLLGSGCIDFGSTA